MTLILHKNIIGMHYKTVFKQVVLIFRRFWAHSYK
jgi:hypothetical protein